ncbi:MAG: hypothetical protein LQ352_006375 [Teloschistes flavicans]|nr:MAG: hypothetical protein LQ352_006375 [Teloschistes flavicans]
MESGESNLDKELLSGEDIIDYWTQGTICAEWDDGVCVDPIKPSIGFALWMTEISTLACFQFTLWNKERRALPPADNPIHTLAATIKGMACADSDTPKVLDGEVRAGYKLWISLQSHSPFAVTFQDNLTEWAEREELMDTVRISLQEKMRPRASGSPSTKAGGSTPSLQEKPRTREYRTCNGSDSSCKGMTTSPILEDPTTPRVAQTGENERKCSSEADNGDDQIADKAKRHQEKGPESTEGSYHPEQLALSSEGQSH